MQDSNFERLRRLRQIAICGWVFAALVVGKAARASTLQPSISGTPASRIVAGHYYAFTPKASGPKGYPLTFSISGKPSWAGFNRLSGQLFGTPKTANVGRYANIVILVSDGTAIAYLAPFTITVSAPANVAPTIAGTPPGTAAVGTLYTFTPKASDTDGDPISFSIQNKPAWASFSIASGRVSGIPATLSVGTYSSIVISVSDGYTRASLPPFSITVNRPAGSGATGTATLTWMAPTTNTNGSALTDLAGYHIHYGNSPSALSKVIDVANPGTTSYTVGSLASGTWYFAMSAYTTSGLESALSNTGSKAIP